MNTQNAEIERNPGAPPNKVNIFRLLNSFWRENDRRPFSPAAAKLYFFIIDRANRRQWKMPVVCPTSVACQLVQVTRPTLVKARESLCERGLITFTEGTGYNNYPTYSLVLTGAVAAPRSDAPRPEPAALSLDEIETRLAADTAWLGDVAALLSPVCGPDKAEPAAHLSRFFSYLRCQGIRERDECDCRRYFVNWLRKELTGTNRPDLKSTDYGTRQPLGDPRRPPRYSAETERDYTGSF